MLAGALVVVALAVVYSWWRGRGNAREGESPVSPVGLSIRQAAHGFTLSRSEGGHPVFMVHADQAIQLKQSGEARLLDVRIDLYDRNGKRANQISGKVFAYDPHTGTVSAEGPVQMDLGGIPGRADGGKETGRPIHIETTDLTFNTRAGTGQVRHGLTFRYLGAAGSAEEAQLTTHPDVLQLEGDVRLAWSRSNGPPVELSGAAARLEQQTAMVEVDGQARIRSAEQQIEADRLRFFLRRDYSIREAVASGHVRATQSGQARRIEASSEQAKAEFGEQPGGRRAKNASPGQGMLMEALAMSGQARVDEETPQQHNQLAAGQIDFQFGRDGSLRQVRARQEAKLSLWAKPSSSRVKRSGTVLEGLQANGGQQERTITAEGLNFDFVPGQNEKSPRLVRVTTVGRGTVESRGKESWLKALANRFQVSFDKGQHPAVAEATGAVEVEQQGAPVGGKSAPLRTSRSDRLQLKFVPGGSELQEVRQLGQVELEEAGRTVRADSLGYDPKTQEARLQAEAGSAYTHGRVWGEDRTLRFSAPRVEVNQASGEVRGSGGVQVSFLSLSGISREGDSTTKKTGPMFSSGLPVEVTAERMQVNERSGQGVFVGHARLWQGPNLTLADELRFDRATGRVEARGDVVSNFVEGGNGGGGKPGSGAEGLAGLHTKGPAPVSIRAQRFDYSDGQRQGVYEGDVVLTSPQARLTARELKIYLASGVKGRGTAGAARLERVVATGGVKITQPGREARAREVEYDLGRSLITMRGGPPSIYDAEHGYLTGEILTFSPSNDTIRVESQAGTRTFGEYRVRH